MQPAKGPIAFLVSGVDQPIGAGLSVGPVRFRFPRPLFVTSALLTTRAGTAASMAALRLRIQDETFQDVIADGVGGHEASALALSGLVTLAPMFSGLALVRPYALQRPVNTGDEWWITIRNVSGGSIRPELVFTFDEGVTKR